MYTKINLDEAEYRLQIEIDYFKEYVIFNEAELTNRQSVYKKKFLEDLMEFPRKDIMEQLYKDDLLKFPSYFYHSSLILVFSIFETTLKDICEEVTDRLLLPIKVEELYGNNNIAKSIKFLEKFCDLNLIESNKEWAQILKFQKIRNFIVHNNGRLDPNKLSSTELKSISKMDSFTVDAYGNFFMNSTRPLMYVLEAIEIFLKHTIRQLRESNYAQYSVVVKPDPIRSWINYDFEDDLPF